MEAKTAIKKLHDSSEFKDWQKKNRKCYLSHIFYMLGKNKEECQVGYYDEKKNMITSFDVADKIKVSSAERPFKKDEMRIEEVDMDKVKIDFPDAIKIVEDLQKEKYPSERPMEIIAILQNLQEFGNIFNVTHVTQSFKTLNVKISAENGEIMHEQLVSIISFPQKDKENKDQIDE